MVVDTLPANVTFISATGGATFDGTSKVTLNVGNLASGGTATFTITVQPTAAAVAASPISDSATASANEHDPDTNNNTLTASTTILASADLQVTISPSPNPVDAGQNLVYKVTATNIGLSDATSVVVTDTIPTDVTFVSATGNATPDGRQDHIFEHHSGGGCFQGLPGHGHGPGHNRITHNRFGHGLRH